jgi:RimJ/RimL family protein N-acetyltransferase
VELRDVEAEDVDAYVRMRCDPAMMAELGGPLPREGIEEKVRRDVADARSGTALIKMIVPDRRRPTAESGAEFGADSGPWAVAGSATLWHSEHGGEPISEIGWMVLPEFQGRGVGKRAVRMLLEIARDQGRWGLVHAFPGVTNGPSNGICRSLGFTLAGETQVHFAGRALQSNHWVVDPAAVA